jgi:hypothetical protein
MITAAAAAAVAALEHGYAWRASIDPSRRMTIMARITIHVDSETNGADTTVLPQDKLGPSLVAAVQKIGLLHSGPLTGPSGLLKAFKDAVNATGSNVPVQAVLSCTYDPNAINNGKKSLRNCRVIATAGGMAVFNAIKGRTDNPQFVSLVTYAAAGNVLPDTSNTNCRGGVVIHSWDSNAGRITYLTTNQSIPLTNIYLYYNPDANVGINTAQLLDWNSRTNNPLHPQTIASTGNFANDFGVGGIIPGGALGIVISSDPSFGASMNSLINAVNGWLARTENSFVVYPLQDYSSTPPYSAAPSRIGQAAFIGPSLIEAYTDLGTQARLVYDNLQDYPFQAVNDQQSIS